MNSNEVPQNMTPEQINVWLVIQLYESFTDTQKGNWKPKGAKDIVDEWLGDNEKLAD